MQRACIDQVRKKQSLGYSGQQKFPVSSSSDVTGTTPRAYSNMILSVSLSPSLQAAEVQLRELMLQSLAGDAVAHGRLLTQLAQLLRRFCQRRLGHDNADVEDMVQDWFGQKKKPQAKSTFSDLQYPTYQQRLDQSCSAIN